MSDASENLIKSETKPNDIPTKTKKEEDEKTANASDEEKENAIKENGLENGLDGEKESKKNDWEDLLGSGSLMKKVIKEGKPDSRPQRLEKCVINYRCALEDGTLVDKQENFEMLLGDCEVKQKKNQ